MATFEQSLQRRLVEPAGVVNTQKLHLHYQGTQDTAQRLVRRSMLPEQVKFRYGSGVLQPTAIMSRLQRQRTESADGFDGEWRVAPESYSGAGTTTRVSEKRVGGINKQTRGRGDAGTRRIEIPTKISFTPTTQTFVQAKPQVLPNSRRNTGESSAPIPSPVKVMAKPLLKGTQQNQPQESVLQTKNQPQANSANYLVKATQNTENKETGKVGKQQLKINRKATFTEVNALSSNAPHSLYRQGESQSISDSTVNPTPQPNSSFSSTPAPGTSGKLRISRKAIDTGDTSSQYTSDLPLTNTNNPPASSRVISRTEDDSDEVIQGKILPKSNPVISQNTIINKTAAAENTVQSKSTSDLPLTNTNNPPASSRVISRTEDDSDEVIQGKILPKSNPVISQKTSINKTAAAENTVQSKSTSNLPLAPGNTISNSVPNLSQAQTNNRPIVKGIIQNKGANQPGQAKGRIKSVAPVAISGQKQQLNLPLPLAQKVSTTNNTNLLSTNLTQSASSSQSQQKLPLPLAINPVNHQGAIARQTNALENSTVQAKLGHTTMPTPPPQAAPTPSIDLTQVAEQVSRILTRQLTVERERRGISRWH
ncbi:MAG: hypothetical protein F6K41_33885 [Symploca sp. SIO3E6]|nr:hypothetical protein [Caldora sp. SIO3E6]